jgi:cyclopropane fatty-acyl-phospholipid synthase-like methyltransferase
MSETPEDESQTKSQFYSVQYGNYRKDLYAAIRAETYGEDVGQNSWLTVEELQAFGAMLDLPADAQVLEIGSGSGGPTLFLARTFGLRITGTDINAEGVANANQLAHDQQLADKVNFQQLDGTEPLPLAAGSFDAVICLDAINHLRDRRQVLQHWYQALCSGGRLLFTDAITITGLLSSDEIAVRSSIGYFLYAPPGEDERLLKDTGFTVLQIEDATENTARLSQRWHEARERRRDDLIAIEGQEEFERTQRFLHVAHTIAAERRLSRFVFLAQKP